MSRRSLIGEAGKPKTSDKVWNKGTVITMDGFLEYRFAYALEIDLTVTSKVTGNANVDNYSQTVPKGNTIYQPTGLSLGIESFEIKSWSPLEDAVYKYILFPIHLVGNLYNGDKGKVLFKYLQDKYGISNKVVLLEEEIRVDNNEILQCYISENSINLRHGTTLYYVLSSDGLVYSSGGGLE